MSITIFSSREFNQDTAKAKKAAGAGPVFITDRGKPAHVLLSIEEYQRLTGERRNIADALAMPGGVRWRARQRIFSRVFAGYQCDFQIAEGAAGEGGCAAGGVG